MAWGFYKYYLASMSPKTMFAIYIQPKFAKHVGQWPHHSIDFVLSFLSLNCFRLKGIKKNTWHRKMVFFFFTFLSIMHAFSHNQSYEQIDMNYEENSLITYIELTD